MREQLVCDLGTDCTDCKEPRFVGEFATLAQAMAGPSPNAPSVPAVQPTDPFVSALISQGIEVNGAWTLTQPPFVMLYTKPSDDVDVSASMHQHRVVEPLYNLFWYQLSRQCCAGGGLVLDVGANFGYYSLYAAAMGCRVVAWEPVPVFRKFIEAAARLNNFSHRIHLRAAVVSDVAGQTVKVQVPQRGIWGTASVDGMNVDPSIRSTRYEVSVLTERLDDVVNEQACMMKLDVEGYEPKVIAGAERVFAQLPPHHILTEYTPGVMERARKWSELAAYPASLRALWRSGYRLFNLQGTAKNTRITTHGTPWSALPLPPLREVSNASLVAEEINSRNMIMDQALGFAVPWDLHPRSLHAEFAHNTDLLLTLNHSAVPRSRDVGVWEDSPYGLGGGWCKDVLSDGTAMEMVGRLCVEEGRREKIEAAVVLAEQPRPIKHRGARSNRVRAEARHWRIDGPMRSRNRMLIRVPQTNAEVEDGSAGRYFSGWAEGTELRRRGKGRGKRRGKGGGRGGVAGDES